MLPCCFPAAPSPHHHGMEPITTPGGGQRRPLVHLDPGKQTATSQGQCIADIKKSSISVRIGGPGSVTIGSGGLFVACRKNNERSKRDRLCHVIAEDYRIGDRREDKDRGHRAGEWRAGGSAQIDLHGRHRARVPLAWSRTAVAGRRHGVARSSFSAGKGAAQASRNQRLQRRLDRSSPRLAAACDTSAICITAATDAEPSFRLTARLLGHTGTISAIEWSPTGEALASAAIDETIKLDATATTR